MKTGDLLYQVDGKCGEDMIQALDKQEVDEAWSMDRHDAVFSDWGVNNASRVCWSSGVIVPASSHKGGLSCDTAFQLEQHFETNVIAVRGL